MVVGIFTSFAVIKVAFVLVCNVLDENYQVNLIVLVAVDNFLNDNYSVVVNDVEIGNI